MAFAGGYDRSMVMRDMRETPPVGDPDKAKRDCAACNFNFFCASEITRLKEVADDARKAHRLDWLLDWLLIFAVILISGFFVGYVQGLQKERDAAVMQEEVMRKKIQNGQDKLHIMMQDRVTRRIICSR
jgi:hypothetical protein